MTSVYARTREREKAWKFGLYCLAGAIVVAPFWYLIFKRWVIGHNTFMRVCLHTYHPSIILTSKVAVGFL
jgi:ER lumen protein retaining receptor